MEVFVPSKIIIFVLSGMPSIASLQVKLLRQRFCYRGKRGPGNETLKKRKERTAFYNRFQPSAGPGNNGFEVQHGQWTAEETCLFDTIESFLYATGILASCKSIATLFNFVVKGPCATNLNLTANTKTVKQIQGKMKNVDTCSLFRIFAPFFS